MTVWLTTLSPVIQALLGTLFTWAVTALGAAMVFLFRTLRHHGGDAGFSVMMTLDVALG